MAGMTAFREAYINPTVSTLDQFDSWEGRQLRYALMESYFNNSAYRNVHTFASKLKADFGLYKYTRPIYNPAYALFTFWQTHLWGGRLDVKNAEVGALPIVTDNAALRPAIIKLWLESNWQVNKDIFTLSGAMCGDCFARIVDSPSKGRVYIEILKPSVIADIETDNVGNVRGYTLIEQRYHPEDNNRVVEYKEIARRDGVNVVYSTFLNNAPFDWSGEDGNGAEWAVPYGFVPMVFHKHNDVGQAWGYSEAQPALAMFREIDDIASKISDQIRKTVDPKLAVLNVEKPAATPTVTGRAADNTVTEPGRDELTMIYLNGNNGNADIKPVLGNLNIADALTHLDKLSQKLERDYPELRLQRLLNGNGERSSEVSGEALRRAQQPAANKVIMRRANYDNALVRLQQMGVAIGGWRGYAGYEGFGLDSYASGALNHSIGERPVFDKSAMDDLAEEKALWEAAEQAGKAGVSIEVFLERRGWSDDDIAKVKAAQLEKPAPVAVESAQ